MYARAMSFREERKTEILKVQLEEWRRKDSAVSAAYDKIRSRSITLIGIQIGVMGYFISRLSYIVKPELYGILFLSIATILGVISLILSIWNYVAKKYWLSPMYDCEIEKMNQAPTVSVAYKILVDDYKTCYDSNLKIHEPAGRRLNWALFTFIASAIILIVLNFA